MLKLWKRLIAFCTAPNPDFGDDFERPFDHEFAGTPLQGRNVAVKIGKQSTHVSSTLR